MKGNLDKKAWLRIVEAFIGIIMITGVVLTLMSRPAVTDTTVQQETVKLEKFILDRIVADPILRSQILIGDTSGVNKVLASSVPAGTSYYAKVCNYDEVCALGMTVPYDVYSEEALVSSNLTYYNPDEVKVIKLFFWQGSWPEGTCPSFCNKDDTQTVCLGNSVVKQKCIENSSNCLYWDTTSTETCGTNKYCNVDTGTCGDLMADIFVGNWETSSQYTWVSGGYTYQRINWSITISNRNPVDFTIKNFTECWKVPPSSFGGLICKTTNAPAGLIVTETTPFTKDSYAYILPSLMPNIYNLTYTGVDTNGNIFSVFKEISFS